MSEHPYGWLSLLPPLAAILLAIMTRRVVTSLLAGVFVGSLIIAGGNPFLAFASTCEDHLWISLSDADHLRVFVFTTLMGAMVGVMQRAGGMEGIVRSLSPFARTRRGGQLTVWGLGLIVFFDDYANSLLLGNTMRPLTDRLRISREKLAYLVDSTAAPVSGLALISTWVAGEIGFIREGFAAVETPEAVDGFQVFIATIPYRFYVLWALILVPIVALVNRDFGPMWKAESNCASSRTAKKEPLSDGASRDVPANSGWWNAVVPVAAVVLVTMALIIVTGQASVAADGGEKTWLNTFGNGNSYLALVYGAAAGLAAAALLAKIQRVLTAEEIQEAAMTGARHVVPALLILWLAWALSGLTHQEYLGTGTFLASILESTLDVRWMPTAVFVLASLVSFATGTSWGTMGILMPLVVTVTVKMLTENNGAFSANDPILIATVGSVLAGAIFGDHCSPISDTTVLSSQASGCDHIAHVRTQLPYALLVGAVSILLGTIPAGFGIPVAILLPTGCIALVFAMLLLGKTVPEPTIGRE